MLIFIIVQNVVRICDADSNTSNVNLYLRRRGGESIPLHIQIHPMLIFIISGILRASNSKLIQIHPMLIFIVFVVFILRLKDRFKYIQC